VSLCVFRAPLHPAADDVIITPKTNQEGDIELHLDQLKEENNAGKNNCLRQATFVYLKFFWFPRVHLMVFGSS
jgi:hypothetical protein